jgi:hypothetical protein
MYNGQFRSVGYDSAGSLHSRTASRFNSSVKFRLVLLIPSPPDYISIVDVAGKTGEGHRKYRPD